jgi:hypothetical protein
MKIKLTLATILSVFWLTSHTQTITVSGYVEDAASSEKLISATVFDFRTKQGITTNTFGFFSLTLPVDSVELVVSYVGYNPIILNLASKKDTFVTIPLRTNGSLAEVQISSKRQDLINNQVQMSQITLPVEQLKKLPALLGEVDVIKALQFLPGIKGGTEGSTGLYVRGGSSDQNLILLDGAPVYNVSHLGGFLSVFNADAIKSVRLTTGGFPARFGGRLSSVIEIDMKEGNMKQFHAEGGIGLLSSRLTLEGPIIKDKMSFIISARRSYVDLLVRPIIASDISKFGNGELTDFGLYFYDLNAKINYKINDQHRLYLSFYNGLDKFSTGTKYTNKYPPYQYNRDFAGVQWGNLTAALRWNWLLSNKVFVNTTATRTTYNFKYEFNNASQVVIGNQALPLETFNGLSYNSDVADWALRTDIDYLPNTRHHLRFGAGNTYHSFSPGRYTNSVINLDVSTATPFTTRKDTTFGNPFITSNELFAYAEDEINLGKLSLNLGLHSASLLVGNTAYHSLQPRASALYKLPNASSLKASIVNMRQFVNLLTNDGLGFPTDQWVTSTSRLKPQDAWQAALGFAKSIGSEYSLSAEVYYKKMTNVLSYKEGNAYIDQVDFNGWEDKVTQGNGEAYGLEIFLQKKEGRNTGWISYTLSWNNRQFDDINNGVAFPFRYDRRHEISFVFNRELSERWRFNLNWSFATSNPVTPPTAVYKYPVLDNNNGGYIFTETVIIYGERNSFRPSLTHRLDIGFDYVVKRKKWEYKWSFGAYNAYNRANAFYYFVSTDYQNQFNPNGPVKFGLSQYSIIPILPSISFNFTF